MRRTTLILSICLLLALLFAIQFSAAPRSLRVNEKGASIDLSKEQAVVALPLENISGRNLAARITLELIDTKDKVKAQSEVREELRTGQTSVRLPLSFDFNKLDTSDQKEFPLYRLRYRVFAGESADAMAVAVEGIISVSEITPELFELHISAARRAREGSRYRVRVQATHPITRRPVRGVQLAGEVELNDGSKPIVLRAAGITDAEGSSALDFNLPVNITDEETDVKVTSRLGIFEQEAQVALEFDRTARILLTTDKSLYQPGQTLHLRALVFDPSERALPSASASFTVEDPDNTTVFRASSTTTRFGVATADWQIPDNTPLGDYLISVEIDDGRFEDSKAQQYVKISRYDLPNFTVNTKADRAYYLPGQNAEVEVRADYLFGQPVTRGKVRVVRETERLWNFEEQKWDTEEGEKIEGELDSKGRFIARINLEAEHKDFNEESYARFRDLSYAAYITDATTNRTEQRRFALRLTNEPIHIYVTNGNYDQAEGMPLVYYIAASYADGTPAQCEVSMQVDGSDSENVRYYGSYASLSKAGGAALPVTTTNRYGVAKITGPPIMRESESQRYLSLKFSARDRQGRTGHHEEGFWLKPESILRVETDKAIYRAGETVHALITSNKAEATLFVDVSSNSKVIRSETIRLENGRASIDFPYDKDFDGKLDITAYFYEPQEDSYSSDEVAGRRTILYPRDRELKLDVRLDQTVYRPGEDAQATLRASGPDGRALESVFGVVIFDKAVEERARTEQEFSTSYGFYNYFRNFWYGSDEVGGISLRELERLDLKRKPVTEELNLVADILLQNTQSDYDRRGSESDSYEKNQAEVFKSFTAAQFKSVKEALDARYDRSAEYPSDAEALHRFLRDAKIDFEHLRDPWSVPYRAVFSVEGDSDVLEIISAGADKEFGTRDDFRVQRFARPYFRSLGEKIDAAINGYHRRTGGFIRDEATLKAELSRVGISDGDLRDRWNEPYKFEFGVSGVLLSVHIKSGGPDKRFDSKDNYGSDDFTIWSTWIDSFSDARDAVDNALNSYLQATGKFPQDEAAFCEALKRAGLARDNLRDPFGHVFIANFKSESRYVDRILIEGRNGAGGVPEKRTTIIPVSQRVCLITLFSVGADGRGGTGDDFNAATFTSIAFEQQANETNARSVQPLATLTGATGALTGKITDASGAVVPGATIVASNKFSSAEYRAVSNDEGAYIIRNLPPGSYTLSISVQGFATFRIDGVPVRSSTLIKVDATLQPAGITETVTVTAASNFIMNTVNATVASAKDVVTRPSQLSTPRLREYFPETLVWQPTLETDKQGRALLSFKLADNITTWKMSIIGSTADGELGTAEREIKSFQPFFVEHDPPRVLTEGDEIALPVVLRNYLDKPQAVDLEIKPEKWFSLMGASQKRAEVRAGDASREVFSFRATTSVKDGKQRITAIGEDASDAIERPVTVHPDGEERAATDSRIFADSATLETDIPVDAIPGTVRGELKIYPSLVGHLFESIEGIMERPYGCGEQTVSSTYPSLLVLRAYRRNNTVPPENIAARATRYLRAGYERLLNYRAEAGGFSYWGGRSEANIALTAYALRFLDDAREFIEVDEDVTKEALEWLIKEQRADGSWPAHLSGDRTKDEGSPMTTALVARTLALYEKRTAKTDATTMSSTSKEKTAHDALRLALVFLDRKVLEMDEPYLIASYALASLDAGENEKAARAITRLRRLAHDEGDGSYWSLESNTPFYGWGLAGRIETTALVLQALTRGAKAQGLNEASPEKRTQTESTQAVVKDEKEETDRLINRGLLFLLKQKDRYGVWYSTQATVNVLDALIALLSSSQPETDNTPGAASVLVNGRLAGTIPLPPAQQLTGPLTLDISKFLSAGSNQVEIARTGSTRARVSAQVVSNYYLPWTKALADKTRQASALKLAINFDKTETVVMNEVTCKVKAERVGFGGYGMLLAEIGLPPGADVDRASLERAMKESGWSFTRYDLLPDRLVVYLWPRAGGTDFEFKFRPRFGLKALTAPSVLYDYYNPEAHTSLAPVRFLVR